MEKTFDWFGARGVTLRRAGVRAGICRRGRRRSTGVELVLLSAGEIPRELAAGRIHLGVTGSDLVREKLADWDAQVEELAPLGFGHADLIIAVPAFWVDVDTLDDLDAAAAAFRARARPPAADRDQVSPAGARVPARRRASPITSWSTARARPRAR